MRLNFGRRPSEAYESAGRHSPAAVECWLLEIRVGRVSVAYCAGTWCTHWWLTPLSTFRLLLLLLLLPPPLLLLLLLLLLL